jgi:hypothetical protein
MISQIRDLIDRVFFVFGLGRDDDLGAFLTDFLEDLVQALSNRYVV